MAELKTSRPFQERFLNGYDRSELRQEVQRTKRMKGLRKKYATWALGGALAFGGIGAPMKMIHDSQAKTAGTQLAPEQETPEKATTISTGIQSDLNAAKSIAEQVAGGVQAAANGVQAATQNPLQTVADAPAKVADAIVEAPQKIANVADAAKEQFFKTQVPFGSIIYNEAKKQNLPPELVAAVVHTESKFKPNARSGAGAMGLMQLVPKTGRWMGARNLMNPSENIMAGTKYLKYLADRFDGDQQKMIAAYNAGEGNVRRFGGVPPFKETRNYVKRVRTFQNDLRDQLQNSGTQVADADLR
jgi:soluble lytic murein transglycosylase-like protein